MRIAQDRSGARTSRLNQWTIERPLRETLRSRRSYPAIRTGRHLAPCSSVRNTSLRPDSLPATDTTEKRLRDLQSAQPFPAYERQHPSTQQTGKQELNVSFDCCRCEKRKPPPHPTLYWHSIHLGPEASSDQEASSQCDRTLWHPSCQATAWRLWEDASCKPLLFKLVAKSSSPKNNVEFAVSFSEVGIVFPS